MDRKYGSGLDAEQRLARIEQIGVGWQQRAGAFAGILIGGTTTSWTGGVAGNWGGFIPAPGSSGFVVARERHAGSSIVGNSGGWSFLTIPKTGLWQITVRVYAELLDGTTERVGVGLMGAATGSAKVYATEVFRCIGHSGAALERNFTFDIFATEGDVIFPSFLRVGSTTTFNSVIVGGAASFGCSLAWVYLG